MPLSGAEKTKRLSDKKIAIVREYKARGCACGEVHPAALDLHHRDPESKHPFLRRRLRGGKWTTGGWRSLRVGDIDAELKKCDVLCANCHRKLKWGHLRSPTRS